MRHEQISISGVGIAVGRRVPVRAAADTDPADSPGSTRQDAVAVSRISGAELAAQAAEVALADARYHRALRGRHPQHPPVDVHLHVGGPGCTSYDGARRVRDRVGHHGPGVAVGLAALSASSLTGIDLLAGVLDHRPDVAVALISAEQRCGPVPAWHTELGMPCGDAGSALVLTRGPGCARLLASASWTDPLPDDDTTAPLGAPVFPPDRQLRRAPQPASLAGVARRRAEAVRWVCRTVLQDADLDADTVTVLPPFSDDHALHDTLHGLGLRVDHAARRIGAELGHLGASDQCVALYTLLQDGALTRGDQVLLLDAGLGMSTTACLLRITGP